MIRQKFDIELCGWTVYVYYAVDCYDIGGILERLSEIGCDGAMMRQAVENLSSCKLNTGLTYSNLERKETVMVIGMASSQEEFVNSLCHERKHLEAHIAQALGIDPYGEDICYIAGEIALRMFSVSKLFICDCKCCKDIKKQKTH